ncbi:GNAT family N-acetyltransferase [Sungkyunkwania multivorans]|uniref:GNAT family N-acetyltransferase n=1 Tax=Sungkyunkwania multivorans TaxID=1173618 RepID=A0ABW3CZ00_9FLAO
MEKYDYQIHLDFPKDRCLAEILPLYSHIFDVSDDKRFIERLRDKSRLLSVLAYHKDQLIGFKIGYELDRTTFYSWVGGIEKNFRRKGIARKLAIIQHEAIKDLGYTRVRTKSKNEFKPMMIFNLKNGFDIIGTEIGRKGETKIIFEKML